MMLDRTPTGARTDVIEDWLQRVGELQESTDGRLIVALTPEALRDFAEWVAAFQREAIAQTLITMPDGVWAKHCADAVRTMRAEH